MPTELDDVCINRQGDRSIHHDIGMEESGGVLPGIGSQDRASGKIVAVGSIEGRAFLLALRTKPAKCRHFIWQDR